MKRMTPAEAVMLWLPVEGYPMYEVSNTGYIRSWFVHRGQPGPRILTPAPDSKGYLTTRLSNDDGARTVKVHVVVARAFHGPRPKGLQVRHLDSDNQNNRADNLAYGTQLENMQDRVLLKTHCKQGHEFSPENSYMRPISGRACRACLAASDRRRRDRERAAK